MTGRDGVPLELRPNCECCGTDLPPESTVAFICSFECTYCLACAQSPLHFNCPNCGVELTRRPVRPQELLVKYPGSAVKLVRALPCEARL